MDKTLIETLKQWNITSVLPPSVGAFQLSAEFQTVYREGDEEEFCLFRYRLAAKPWSVRAVYTPSAAEFSVRTDLGMLEFALIDFITDDWERFRHLVATRLVRIMTDYYVHCEHNFTAIVKGKKACRRYGGTVFCRPRMKDLYAICSRAKRCGL